MIYLGRYTAGAQVFYGANFHNDIGNLEDPASPAARLRSPSGAWSTLSTPTKQDSATGFYGGVVNTAGFSTGQYIIRLSGIVSNNKSVATIFCFEIGPVVATLTADYDAAKEAASQSSVNALASGIPTPAEIADKVLSRNIAGGSDGGRTVTNALRALVNKREIVGETLKVYDESDSNVAWSASVDVSSAPLGVYRIDPE